MTKKSTADMSDLPTIAKEILAAARAEPGQVPSSLRLFLDRAGTGTDEVAALLAAVHESQILGARLRRRTAELEALFSTARELVRLQDVNDVLRRLVQRAHDLMGTDVTYLSEVEVGTQDLIVRHSVGTVTPEFRDLLVPAGYGLASRVVQTREPVWVSRYETMQLARRDSRIDAAVVAEGLVSFLGVPLAVGDEVLGALFACNRFPHESSPDEVLLLSAFADHAAAVLHSVRVLASAETATLRAEEAYQELEKHLSATELAGAVHEELTSAVISGGTVVDIVETLARSLDTRVWAIDENGRALHLSEEADLPSRTALDSALAQSRSSGHVASVHSDDRGWFVVAILGADRVLGAIVAEEQEGLPDDIARRTLERAAHVAALVSFKQEAVSAIRAERRARWLLMTLDGRDPSPDGGDPLVPSPKLLTGCAVVSIGGSRGTEASAIAERAVGDTGFVALHRDDRIIVAWTIPDVLDSTERLRRVLADNLREPQVTAVACVRDVAPNELPEIVDRASRDLSFLPALGVTGTTVSSDAFAPYHVLSPSDPETVGRFIDGLLGNVIAWDNHRDARLFETLLAYFEEGENRSVVAASLHIHKNTVQQRLERIQALLNGELSDPEFRFRLQAAVRLEHLRRTLRAGTTAASNAETVPARHRSRRPITQE
ncbi:helix-turn-helix domain-containing protein [Microbacterium pseudoresistens]|uniref:PAS domain-containing protein n=1 Tax=Microbacterium pseudoresistens TaxID=640634 RepID=A0A7Y9JLZ0_9MICO|nr:helix-turn-helix domain-containing protein [Microbacterium pseudoresistens]NYD53845.1 PAS domain-containing protein [Microbacterium pseudoresistens]